MHNAMTAWQFGITRLRHLTTWSCLLGSCCSLASLLSACGFQAATNSTTDHPDAPIDMPGQSTFGDFLKVTFSSASDVPKTAMTIDGTSPIDTDTSELCNKNNDQTSSYCVIAATGISISAGGTLAATGSKPLLLLATAEFQLDGTIDVSSVRGGQTGAGAIPSCTGSMEPQGHSGGFGGSFGAKGGDGETAPGSSEAGGVAAAAQPTPTRLQGGCPGGSGATDADGAAGSGGAGGGAVGIIANSIVLNGKIDASGASGAGGTANNSRSSGGGGGGAGGMIVLDTPAIRIGAGSEIWLYANGGGGGQGGTGTGASSGAGDGGAESLQPAGAGIGGNNGARAGGSGGNGSAGPSKVIGSDGGLRNAGANAGGGGGGGGAGFIRTPVVAALTSPPATNP